MDYKEYSSKYDEEIDVLKSACSDFEQKLKDVLSDLLSKEFFRVRITEARVKDKDSLFVKLREDNIEFSDAFSVAGKVRDLIGARIVCHNLSDMNAVLTAIEKAGDIFTLIRPIGGKEKCWVEQAQKDFGYRGWHVDVRFKSSEKQYQAELQVRTILQDAWATFMHHDVYKGPIKTIVKNDIAGMTKGLSDLLYGLDQMAQALRNYVEENPISPEIKIKKLDALQHQMRSFVEFYTLSNSFPRYKKVRRVDRYIINGESVSYHHFISAEAEIPLPFEFLLGGDSGTQYFKMKKLVHKKANSSNNVKFNIEHVSDTMVKIWKRPKNKQKLHEYEVLCDWNNIFEQEFEYIFSPWGVCYDEAIVDYRLEIVCKDDFVTSPRFYMLDLSSKENLNLNELFKKFGTSRDSGEQMKYDKDNNLYHLDISELHETVLCLMHFKRPLS